MAETLPPPPWPRIFAPPAEVQQWLTRQRSTDKQGARCLLTLRWLIDQELDRRQPDPPKAITEFVPDKPSARPDWPPDLSTGRTQ